MAVEDKVDFLISQVDHLQNITLVAGTVSGMALVCTAIALITMRKALKALNEPPPPLPTTSKVPLPVPEHPYDLDELHKYRPRERNHDILAGLAKELKL